MPTKKEFERRWLVTSVDPDILRSPFIEITQGYVGMNGPRIRISVRNGEETAEAVHKTGHGLERTEDFEPLPLRVAKFFLQHAPYVIRKRRHLRDGWEIDFFKSPLNGLVLAEFEMDDPCMKLDLPPWIHSAIEVTDTLTNRHLARLAYDLSSGDADRPVRELLSASQPRVVVTGGPGSGKSTLIETLRREIGDCVHCVPETATIIISQVRAKPPVGDLLAMRQYQRVFYQVQCGFEQASILHAVAEDKRGLVLDRGTVDNAAYLPLGVPDFEKVCMTDLASEYARYSAVVCLSVPPRDIYETIRGNNPARGENYEQAKDLDLTMRRVRSGHRNFRLIDDDSSWENKLEKARHAVLDELKIS